MTATVLRHSRSLLPKLLPQPTATVRRTISTFPYIFQVPELQEAPGPPAAAPLPPNPSTGSPLYQENWRGQNISAGVGHLDDDEAFPVGSDAFARMMAFCQTADLSRLKDQMDDWTSWENWSVAKQLFECWIRSLDASGKPNKPDVYLFNRYLSANLMMEASAGEMLDLFAQMQDYQIAPNSETYKLVNCAMFRAQEKEASEKLIDRGWKMPLYTRW